MPVKNYRDDLLKQLKNRKEATEYLNACLEDSAEVFLSGLRNVVEAHGGVGALSKSTALNRESLYRTLSKRGNPTLSSLSAILDALGIHFQLHPLKRKRQAA